MLPHLKCIRSPCVRVTSHFIGLVSVRSSLLHINARTEMTKTIFLQIGLSTLMSTTIQFFKILKNRFFFYIHMMISKIAWDIEIPLSLSAKKIVSLCIIFNISCLDKIIHSKGGLRGGEEKKARFKEIFFYFDAVLQNRLRRRNTIRKLICVKSCKSRKRNRVTKPLLIFPFLPPRSTNNIK